MDRADHFRSGAAVSAAVDGLSKTTALLDEICRRRPKSKSTPAQAPAGQHQLHFTACGMSERWRTGRKFFLMTMSMVLTGKASLTFKGRPTA